MLPVPCFSYGTVWLLFEVQPEGVNLDERQTDPRGDAWRDTSALPRRINTSRGVNDTLSGRVPPSTLSSGADTPEGTSPALDDELAVEPEMVMPWAEDAAGLEVRLPNSSSFKCGSACARLGAASPNLIVFNRCAAPSCHTYRSGVFTKVVPIAQSAQVRLHHAGAHHSEPVVAPRLPFRAL